MSSQKENRINILSYGQMLTNLRFTDDIIPISDNRKDIKQTLQELRVACSEVGPTLLKRSIRQVGFSRKALWLMVRRWNS